MLTALRFTRPMRERLLVAALAASLGACSYVGTMLSQAELALKQITEPEQRTYKHMLDRETFFVFGTIDNAAELDDVAIAVIALSDRFQAFETVDVNHMARPDSYYGLNLPAGDFRLLVVSDRDRDGYYDQTEVLGGRTLALDTKAVPDRVLGGYDIDLARRFDVGADTFRVAVRRSVPLARSLFYPKGSLRSLDDPLFAPDMASLGLYRPAAFMEAAPMMFYAIEEDIGHKIPIVFVHGIGGSVRDFEHIVARIDRNRFKPWFFYYPSGTDLEQLGAMFYKLFLSGTTIQLEQMPMVIVAHSMGGLVVREAMNLLTGSALENRVAQLITVASPLGGHPGAKNAKNAPVVIPSWLDLAPDSRFIAQLHRKSLPAELHYHLLFAFADDRAIKTGGTSDGVVPLASQLSPPAQREASAQLGFDATHSGILDDAAAIREILRIAAEVRVPLPESHMEALRKGGFELDLGPRYSPMEAYCIHNLGVYMAALASGAIEPVHATHTHFVRAVRGELPPDKAFETAWIKFSQDFPERAAAPSDEGATQAETR